MPPLAIVALVALALLIVPVVLWYVHARTTLANNPNLIQMGMGSVKQGLFLRLQRRYAQEEQLAAEEARLRAAAVVLALYGEEPQDERVRDYVGENADAVGQELAGLAGETERVRRLVTDALHFATRLPARDEAQPERAAEAVQRAAGLGILLPGREKAPLWAFTKDAVRFLSEENRLGKGEDEGASEG
jgi:hypothetical protein